MLGAVGSIVGGIGSLVGGLLGGLGSTLSDGIQVGVCLQLGGRILNGSCIRGLDPVLINADVCISIGGSWSITNGTCTCPGGSCTGGSGLIDPLICFLAGGNWTNGGCNQLAFSPLIVSKPLCDQIGGVWNNQSCLPSGSPLNGTGGPVDEDQCKQVDGTWTPSNTTCVGPDGNLVTLNLGLCIRVSRSLYRINFIAY